MPTDFENQDKKNTPSESREFDLGTAIALTAKGSKKLGRSLVVFVAWLGEVVLLGLIFLKKRLLWIALAVAVGFGWGTYKSFSGGSKYSADMTARFNYGSAVTLYGTVDYLNALINDGSVDTLGKIFSISPLSAASIMKISVEPVDDALAASDLYREQYLNVDRTTLVRMDTFWARTIPFSDFKKNLTRYDMPLQKITITANRADIFAKLQQGILNEITANTVLRENADIENGLIKDEEKILATSLNGLDTLRTVYNERLRSLAAAKEPGVTNMNLGDKALLAPNPELELYDKMLVMKDELKQVRERSMNNQDVIQVYSPFSKFGKRADFLTQRSATYSMKAFIGILLLLLAIEIYQFIGRREKEREETPGAAQHT